jgi:hypothetical protein
MSAPVLGNKALIMTLGKIRYTLFDFVELTSYRLAIKGVALRIPTDLHI